MRIKELYGGFVIVRGGKQEVFFCFFVDSDRSSWSKRGVAAHVYPDHKIAELALIELRRRAALKRTAPGRAA